MEHFQTYLLDIPVAWMQRQIEQISAFLWHYYVVLFLFMAILSTTTARIYAGVQREGDAIKSEKTPVVQTLLQLNDVTSKVSNRR